MRQAVGADGAPARGRPAGQEHRRRRDQLRRAARRGSRSWSSAGEREGATRRSISCALPETGYWFPPTMFLDVAPANRIAVEEIFGPVVSVTTFRTPEEAVERANNSAYGLAAGVWTDNGAKAFEVAGAAARRRRLAEHLQQVRPDGRVRRLQGERLRARGRPVRAAALREGGRMSRRAPVAKTYKLYLGGAFVRSESGRSDPDRRSDAGRQRPARLAQGRPRRRQGRPRRARRLVEADGLQPRAGALPVRRGAGVARDELARRPWRSRAACRRAPSSARPSICSSTTRAGRTSSPAVMGGINPVAGAVPVVLRPGADGRRGGAGAGRARRARAWCARSPRRWPRATRSSRSSRAAGRCARWTSARSPASRTSRAAC